MAGSSTSSSSTSDQGKVTNVHFGLWWPSGDPDKLRQAADAWNAIANRMETVTTTLSGAADAVTSANFGTAIDAFAPHWRRTGGSGGALPIISGSCRDMAKALSDFAGEIDNARTKILELAAEIAASVVIGVGLAFFTAGLSAEAVAGTTAYIVEAAEALGIELAEQAAAIIARTVVMASMGSLESMATNTIVQLGRNIVFNENHNPFDGFNLDEVTTAGEFGFLVGGTIAGIQSLRGLSRAAADVKGASVPRGGGSTPLEGPPWSVAEGIPGSARGKSLNPPNARHTVSGAKSDMARGKIVLFLGVMNKQSGTMWAK
ncbi:MAG: WXG100 family type VII secretion target [Pseudonocardiaceae bacterium]